MDHAKMDNMPDTDEANRIIAEEYERLRQSPLFTRSPVLSRLLHFLVDHRLRGGRSAPKAYAIATEALGRSADFDPAVDSYPRVMVGRLRNLLDRYYAETAWVNRLRVPQGSYEIVVQHRSAPPERGSSDNGGDDNPIADATTGAEGNGGVTSSRHAAGPRRAGSPMWRRRLALAAAVVAAVAGGWWLAANWGGLFTPATQPMPLLEVGFPQSGDTPISRALSRALDGRLRDGLRRFDLVDLRSASSENDAAERPDYRLDVSLVWTIDGPADVTLVLNRVADQRTIWSQQLHLARDQMPEFAPVDAAIAQIAGDYGVIVRDQLSRHPDDYAPGFPCLSQYNRMRQLRDKAAAQRVDRCLRVTLDRNPRDPATLAALSLVRFGDWQPQQGTKAGKQAFDEARALAGRAYQTGTVSAAAMFAMARSNFYSGNCQGGMTVGEAARRLNPYDADIAGFLGMFKVACGQMGDGRALLERSLALDATAPGVPAATLAFIISQRGDQDAAMEILDRVPSPSNLEPQFAVVRAIVLARQGKPVEAQRVWQRLLDYTHQPATAAPELVLRQFMINPDVIARASAALRQSGVVAGKPAP